MCAISWPSCVSKSFSVRTCPPWLTVSDGCVGAGDVTGTGAGLGCVIDPVLSVVVVVALVSTTSGWNGSRPPKTWVEPDAGFCEVDEDDSSGEGAVVVEPDVAGG